MKTRIFLKNVLKGGATPPNMLKISIIIDNYLIRNQCNRILAKPMSTSMHLLLHVQMASCIQSLMVSPVTVLGFFSIFLFVLLVLFVTVFSVFVFVFMFVRICGQKSGRNVVETMAIPHNTDPKYLSTVMTKV